MSFITMVMLCVLPVHLQPISGESIEHHFFSLGGILVCDGLAQCKLVSYSDNIIWNTFSPTTSNNGHGAEFEDVVILLSHLLIIELVMSVLREALYGHNLPDMTNCLLVFWSSSLLCISKASMLCF
jgi:hypothetical protein